MVIMVMVTGVVQPPKGLQHPHALRTELPHPHALLTELRDQQDLLHRPGNHQTFHPGEVHRQEQATEAVAVVLAEAEAGVVAAEA